MIGANKMEKVEKSWGYEHWFVNIPEYCGKLLFVKRYRWSSKGAYHYHKIKDETFFIIDGILRLDYVTDDGQFKTIILQQYDSFRVKPGMKHKFTANNEDGCKFIETSTTHRDEDSYRVVWNEETESWDDVNN